MIALYVIPTLKAILGSFIGRIVLASILGLAALKGYGLYERNKGASGAVASIDSQAKELTLEAVTERQKAHKPGSFDRLRKSYCRDC